MSFEENLEQINRIINKLSDSSTTIDEGIELYKQALGLCKDCLSALDEAKGKISLLRKEYSNLTEEPFGVNDN